jgi:hypothetical protein
MTAVAQRQFENHSGLDFVDISSEEWREYTFESGAAFRVEHPLRLHVSDNGHRLYDAEGVSHYIPSGWIHLKWKAKDGSPNFVL